MANYKISAPGKPDLFRNETEIQSIIRHLANDDDRADLWLLILESKAAIVITVIGVDVTIKKLDA